MNAKEKIKKLNEIYSKIPIIKCKEDCHECCGCNQWLPIEAKNILEFLKKNNITERKAKSLFDYCPYIENDKCLIYPVRPIICRLFGVVKKDEKIANIECSYAKPEKFLTEKEADLLMLEVTKL
jgi:hypothetical protein